MVVGFLERMQKHDEITTAGAPRRNETRGASPSLEIPAARPAKSSKKLSVIVLCALLALGALWAVREYRARAAAKKGPATRSEPPAVPVVAGAVVRKDVPIYLDGLGTVQAFNTVTVRVRVDGQLQKSFLSKDRKYMWATCSRRSIRNPTGRKSSRRKARKARMRRNWPTRAWN